MSMPFIDISPMDIRNALSNVVASIALEEAALSHILNAEGEKIQAAVKLAANPDELISFNASVYSLLNEAAQIERVLLDKLNVAMGAYETYKTL